MVGGFVAPFLEFCGGMAEAVLGVLDAESDRFLAAGQFAAFPFE